MKRLIGVAMVIGVLPVAAPAWADVVADAAIVRTVTSDTKAHVGDRVKISAIAEDLGPEDVVDDSLDVTYFDPSQLKVLRESCGFVSPDTPSCEFGAVPVGERLRTSVVVKVLPTRARLASISFCTSYEGSTIDPDPSNNCAKVVIRIVGRRG